MAKRGRPPKSRPAMDYGTPELRARRSRLAGNGDITLVSYPLGVLLANGEIGEEAHQAGCRYAWLYGFVFGRTGSAALGWMGAPKAEPRSLPDELASEIESDFRRAAKLLAQAPGEKSALEELIVFGREPRWMRPVAPRLADVAAAKQFYRALDILCAVFPPIDRSAESATPAGARILLTD